MRWDPRKLVRETVTDKKHSKWNRDPNIRVEKTCSEVYEGSRGSRCSKGSQ